MSNSQHETNSFISNAEPAMAEIGAAIGAGSTLAKFCRDHQPPLIFKLVSAWITADETRATHYAAMVKVRESHQRDDIIEQLYGILTADITLAFDNEHALKPLDQIPQQVRHWIAGVEIEEMYEGRGEEKRNVGRLVKIKFQDKMRGTELLMRNLAMLVDKHELEVKPGLAELIAGLDKKGS